MRYSYVKNSSSMKAIHEGSVSSSTTLSRTSSTGKNHLSVGPGYKILGKLGSGNFGEILLAQSVLNDDKVAVKIEKARARGHQLMNEYKLYKKMGSNQFMPAILHYCQTPKFNALVMELMGPSLEDIFKSNNNSFTLKSILLIAMKLMSIFQFVHSLGIIYRDVKPQNFVVGLSNAKCRSLFIIDFGLAKEYINPVTKKHISYLEKRNLTGTARYMSINTHLGREQSRRDDLESIGHMLLYFLLGSLPWQGLPVLEGEDHYSKIGRVKRETSVDDLCKDVHPTWAIYLKYARGLDFYENPDYNFLESLFKNMYQQNNFTDDVFDWDYEASLSSRPSINSSQYVNNSDRFHRFDTLPGDIFDTNDPVPVAYHDPLKSGFKFIKIHQGPNRNVYKSCQNITPYNRCKPSVFARFR